MTRFATLAAVKLPAAKLATAKLATEQHEDKIGDSIVEAVTLEVVALRSDNLATEARGSLRMRPAGDDRPIELNHVIDPLG